MSTAKLYRVEVMNTEEFYIGSTADIRQRMASHLSQLKHGVHRNKRLQKRYTDGFKLGIEEIASGTREEMYKLEQDIITENIDNEQMLNVGIKVKGGDNLTRNPNKAEIVARIRNSVLERYAVMTEDEREKLSERMRGSSNPMFGRNHSEITRKRLSELLMGHSYNKGITLSLEHRKKISEQAKLRIGDKNPFFGKTHSEETRKKLSDKAKGQTPTRYTSIKIDGVFYETYTAAAKALGVVVATITHRVKSKNPKYNGYKPVRTGVD